METEPAGITEDQVASILKLRRARAEAFGTDLFGDIAWDILLQLYAAALGERSMRLKDLDLDAPSSTIARWVAVLEERGLLICHLGGSDAADLRLELSRAAAAELSKLFRRLRAMDPID